MKIKRKIIYILLITLLTTSYCQLRTISLAADTSLFKVRIDKEQKLITKDSIELEWLQVDSAAEYKLSYYLDKMGDASESIINNVYERNVAVNGLKPGIIYDFKLAAYNEDGIELIGDDDNYKLKAITAIDNFRANKIDETIAEDQVIIGEKPGLALSWDKPLVKVADKFTAIPDNQIEYEIVIKKSKTSVQDSVERFKITYNDIDGKYHLNRWNGREYELLVNEYLLPDTSSYNLVDTSSSVSFEWKKEADNASGIINPTNGNPVESVLKPGSLYYIEIYPRFKAGTEYEDVNYIKTDLETGFADTYLKVELARHNDNVIFTGYRILNDGTFTPIPNFLYEFWVGTDETSLYRQYYENEADAGDFIENYIDAFITNAALFKNYYKLTATFAETTEDDLSITLMSQIFCVNLSEIETVVNQVPENLEILNLEYNDATNGSNITLRWDKLGTYEDMIDSGDYKYHIYTNTVANESYDTNGEITVEELPNDEGVITTYERKYREAFNVQVKNDDALLPNKERLKIVDSDNIKSGELDTGNDRIELTFEGEGLFESDPDGYPSKLFNNKLYFIKICVSKAGEIITQYSLPIAFVTPEKVELDPYLPNNIAIAEVTHNELEINWEPLILEDKEYFSIEENPEVNYEVSLSKDSEREIILDNEDNTGIDKYGGFTEPLYTILSDDADISISDIIEFKKMPLTDEIIGVRIKGEDLLDDEKKLLPNSNYHALIRTKLSVSDAVYTPKYSSYSNLISATTLKVEIEEPPQDEKYPTAPLDFAIAEDEDGNLIIDSYNVALTWTKQDLFDDVDYRIVYTNKAIDNIENWDGTIESLPEDYNAQEVPKENIQAAFRASSNDYRITVDNLFPNSVYFFYLQATKDIDEEPLVIGSEWICVPGTTNLTGIPEGLKVLEVTEEDEDYEIFDEKCNLKISWKGIKDQDLDAIHFDIAYRDDTENEYIITNTENGEELEAFKKFKKTPISDDEYYSVILTGLKSNTKYSIKIRIVDKEGNPISKYTSIVSGRTSFSNEEYKEEYDKEVKEDIYKEKVSKYNRLWYWIYENTSNSKSIDYSIKVRGEKALNYMNNSDSSNLIIDFANIQSYQENKKSYFEVYIPLEVTEYMVNNRKNLLIKTIDVELMLYSNTLDQLKNQAIKEMIEKKNDKSTVDDVYIKINIDNLQNSSTYKRSGSKELISNIIQLSGTADAFSITEKEFEERIIKKLFGNDFSGTNDGLIAEYKEDVYDISNDYSEMSNEIDEIIEKIDDELAEYIEDIINSSSYVKYSEDMDELPNSMSIKLKYSNKKNEGKISAYYIKSKNDTWTKIPSTINYYLSTVLCDINLLNEYKFAVLKEDNQIYDIGNSEFSEDIKGIENKYNISEVFSDTGYIYPEISINYEEVIKVFDKIVGVNSDNYIETNIINIAKKYNLDDKLSIKRLSNSITREEVAFTAMKLYELKTGADMDYMEPSSQVVLLDDRKINISLLKSVQLCIDLGIINEENSVFNPTGTVSRGEYLSILNKVLEIVE